MDLPAELFIRPVNGDEDLFAFSFPFELEGKALTSDDVQSEYSQYLVEDGDLIISGWAAEFDGQDRTNENFIDGAFERGIKSFVEGTGSLLYHHKKEKLLGRVLELEEVPGRGLRFLARVDGAIKGHPELGTVYAQIKKGSLKGLSVGGFFKRKLTDQGRKICDMDMTEISITPVPTHAKPAFSVVAAKALTDDAKEAGEIDATEYSDFDDALASLHDTFDLVQRLQEGKSVKGDPQDLHFLALLLDLEQFSNNLVTKDDTDEGEGGPEDDRVDALIEKTRDALDECAREAHKLASKLGPLPKVQYI